MGGHEGEDNVLRDDDLALFLTINAIGIRGGADDPEPSAAVVAQAKIVRESSLEKCRNAKNIQPRKKLTAFSDSATPSLPVHAGRAWWGGRE